MNFQSILALAAVGLCLAAALAYMIRHRGRLRRLFGVRGQLRRLREKLRRAAFPKKEKDRADRFGKDGK